MHRGLQRDSLLLITDTSLLQKGDEIYGFEPVVKEIEYFQQIFSSIEWIGFEDIGLFEQKPHKSINKEKVEVTMLPALGGKSLKNKIEIIKSYRNMYQEISKKIKSHHFIHVRAPSHPAVIAMLYSITHPKSDSMFWFKYAGSWIDKAPIFYDFQRFLLKKLSKSNTVTINGSFENKRLNFLNFENPCISEDDRKDGLKSVNTKRNNSFLFVGNLNAEKGVDLLFETFKKMDSKIFFIGGGKNLDEYRKKSIKYANMNFVGQKPKSDVINYLSTSLALILPSKTEGFPKVVSEAMNFGCIPIISNVSSISQVIEHKVNGYLLESIDSESIERGMNWVDSLSFEDRLQIVKLNFEKANKNTYEYYINRIVNEIY